MSQLQAREIGARIKQKRKEKGLTQADVAAIASFSTRSLQDYENGITIPYKHLAELGRLLATEPDWFMYGDRADPDRISQLVGEVAEIREMLEQVLGSRGEPDGPAARPEAEEA